MNYRTVAGDTFDFIAYKKMGSCGYMETLINANRQHIGTYIFNAGVEIEIPKIAAETKANDLPPWRK